MDKSNNQSISTQEQVFTRTTVNKTELAKQKGYDRQSLVKRIRDLGLLELYASQTGLSISFDQYKKMRNLPVSLANFIYKHI